MRPVRKAQNHAPQDVRYFSADLIFNARFPDTLKKARLIATSAAGTQIGIDAHLLVNLDEHAWRAVLVRV
jgi:hypothetical protein